MKNGAEKEKQDRKIMPLEHFQHFGRNSLMHLMLQ